MPRNADLCRVEDFESACDADLCRVMHDLCRVSSSFPDLSPVMIISLHKPSQVYMNVAYSLEYEDHTVTAYGYDWYYIKELKTMSSERKKTR